MEVAQELVERGHEVRVLTSRSRAMHAGSNGNDVSVDRVLNLEVSDGLLHTLTRLLLTRSASETQNIELVDRVLQSEQPEAVLIWGMWNVPRSVPAHIERSLPGKVAYYLCDYWPLLPNAYLQQLDSPPRRRLMRYPKRLISSPLKVRAYGDRVNDLGFELAICVSERLREILVGDGVIPPSARVIHGGIRAKRFLTAEKRASSSGSRPLRLLYLGRLHPEKGVHTAVQAMSMINQVADRIRATLRIVGGGDQTYEAELKAMTADLLLGGCVTFESWRPQSELPELMAAHDVLVFPSEWEEPFARTVLEAMAAGLVVVATRRGGTPEVLIEEATGLTFRAGDARDLARQIARLRADGNLRKKLAAAGRARVFQRFTFTRMVDQLEVALREVALGELQRSSA